MKQINIVSKLYSRVAFACLVLLASALNLKAQISVSGGTGLSGTYATFTGSGGLFAALNATAQTGNNITVSITGNISTEDGTNALNAGAWTSITITPNGNRTISGTAASATTTTSGLLYFNGADNVTINGLNSGGNSLTITNTSVGNSSVILFRNDAINNTITNCNLRGSGVWQRSGVVVFSSGTTTGNDGNTISNCDITGTGSNLPCNGIYSVGTSASVANSGITISGNNIYDFFKADSLNCGVRIDTGNTTITISNNKFYQTATRVYTVAYTHAAINIVCANGGNGFTIRGNTIGYANSAGTGTTTLTSGAALGTRYVGIIANIDSTTISNIAKNTIANIYVASTNSGALGNGSLCGIQVPGKGKVLIDSNTISSLYCYQRATGGAVVGINTGTTGNATVSNNIINKLTHKDSLPSYAVAVYGIYNSAASNLLTVNNNTIGGVGTDSLIAGTFGSSTAIDLAGGILLGNTVLPVTFNCYNNTIQCIGNYGTGAGYTKGIGGVTTTNNTSTVSIYNNTIRNLVSYGAVTTLGVGGHCALSAIQLPFGLNPTIYGNTIFELSYSGAATTNVVAAGITIGQATTPSVYKNRIYAIRNKGKATTLTTPSVACGIAVRSATTTDSIYNNMISLGNGDTTNTVFVGIWGAHGGTPDPSPNYVLHNTVNIEGTQNSGAMPSFCFHRGPLTATATTVATVIKNNLFHNARTGGTTGHYAIGNCFNATGATTGITSNFNILNAPNSAKIGYHNAANQDFATWKTTFGETNSSSAATVSFTNSATGDLHINLAGNATNVIESYGDATVGITTDYDGQARPGPTGSVNGGAQAPDVGADEWDGNLSYSCTTPAVNSVNASVTSFTCNGGTTVLTLGSTVIGTGNTYQWQFSRNGSSWSNVSGATNASYTATINSDSNYFRCAVTCANGPVTVNSTSSTLITSVASLSGTYTINKNIATGGTNFVSIDTAFKVLNCRGISGAVVLNVVANSGPYTEQVSLSPVTGASATNTITLNGNGNTLSFNSGNAALRSGIILNGADYVTINNLIIDGSAGTYGWGVLLTAGADYNTISNCTINVSTSSTTSSNHYGIVISGSTTSPTTSGTNGSYNTIMGNTINGGYYNMSIYGNSTAALYNQNNTISNNILQNSYLYSMYCVYQKNATISGNDISRPTRTTTSTYAGVYFSTGGGGNLITKNKIHNTFDGIAASTSTSYGIYVAADGALNSENVVSNNLIYTSSRLGTGAAYGIYNSGASYNLIYHNTIYLGDTATSSSGLAYGIYQTTTVSGIAIKNNLVYISRNGSGAHRCIYLATTATVLTCNYNNFYINAGGSDNYIGNFGTTPFATLNNWKTANSNAYDQNSVDKNPQFVDAATGDFTPNSGAMDNAGTPVGITTDILNNTRDNTTPDIGAIEFSGAGCTDPPASGTATVNNSFACSGTTFNLDVINASSGSGITYQWQSSTDNSNWSDIGSSQTSTGYSTSQTSSTYYRVAVSCSGGIPTYSTSILVTTPTTLSGAYTINSGAAASSTNFTSFTSAVNYLSCGITGAVTFTVASGSGPYNEQITIPSVPGASATKTITFNGNGRTISFNSSNSNARAVITLNGADFVTINNLTINATSGTYGWGVFLTNQADSNTISNCNINVSTSNTTSVSHSGIVASGSSSSATTSGNNANYTTVSNCTISGGYYPIIFYGNTTTGSENRNNKIQNCRITDAYSYSIYFGYQKFSEAKGNNISRPNRTNSTSTAGVFITTGGEGNAVVSNKIHNMFDAIPTSTSLCYSIYIVTDGTAANPTMVTNNLIYNIGGNGTNYGIYNSTGAYMYAYHNTIVLNDQVATSGAAYGIYQTGATTVSVKNNIVEISRSGTGAHRCLNYLTTTSTISSDYNNLYVTSTGGTDNSVGYYSSTSYTSLAAWQAVNTSAFDQNSVSTSSQFVDAANEDYTPYSAAMNDRGVNVGVTTDINSTPRSNINPDMGAIEFDGPPCTSPPTAGTATSSTSIACISTNFTLGLNGNSSGTTQTYQWQISADNSNWTDIGSTQTAAGYVASQTSTNYYRCAVTCSGNTSYSNSVLVTTTAQPSGTYTIDKTIPSSTTNFTSIAAAVATLGCGITSPVTFNVVAATGPYIEQITIPDVVGTSATNTITFNGNGNTVLDTFNLAATRTAFILNGSDHIIINNFIVDVTAGTYGWGVLFTNQADSNIVSNCTINTSTTNITSGNHYPIVFSGSTTSPTTAGNNGNYNTISNCTLSGGYYNVVLYGNSTTGGENIGNKILNNTITDAYAYSIYAVYQTQAIFRGNDISRPTRSASTTASGVYLTTGGSGNTIEKNKVHNMFDQLPTSTSTCYGIYVATAGTSVSPTMVTNNLIYNIGGNGAVYGIYNSTGAYMYAYHNTIAINDQTATTGAVYGIYQTGATTLNYANNNIVISRTGTGVKYCMYFNTTTSIISSDYNNLVMLSNSGTTNAVGYFGSALTTLVNWQATNGGAFDPHSVAIDPHFINPATGNFLPNALAFDNLGTNVGVTTDIVDSTRSITTPDIGAYEFSVQGCSNPPTAGSVSVASTTVCSGTNFTLSLTGNSYGEGQTYQWQESTNNSNWTNIGPALDSTNAYVTSQTVSKYYRCAVKCNAGTTVYTSSVLITTPALVSGTFTINKNAAASSSNFTSFATAVNYINCGINGPVVFNVVSGTGPYNEQITMPAVSGTSSTNTITINGNGNTVSFSSSNSGVRHGLLLNGTDYVTVNNLSIDVSAGTYGFGIVLTAGANNNTITNCTVNAGRNATSSNYAGILLSGASGSWTSGTSGNNNTISNNTVYGGYYGIGLYGNTTTMQTGNVVSGNNVVDVYLYNIYLLYQSGAVVRGNDVYRTTTRTSYSTSYGVILSTSVSGTLVDKNKIHDLFAGSLTATSTSYCLYAASGASSGNENKFTNNIVYNIKCNGTTYAIYNTSGAYCQYYHNTVNLDYSGTTSAGAYGFYQTGAVSGIVFRNNIISVTAAGTGIKRCIYLLTAGTDVTANNNYYYLVANGSSDANLGQTSVGSYATLVLWQGANSNAYDQNSQTGNPGFVNAASGNLRPTASAINTLGANVGVTDDIVGLSRTVTYTAGAYQNDITGPTISYTALGNDCAPNSGGSVSLNATISDVSGVPTSGGTLPRIYFKRNSNGTWLSSAGTLSSGTATNGTWNFTIYYSSMNGFSNGDSVYYFVIAQDAVSTPNITSSPNGAVATSVNSVTTYPTGNYFRAITYTPSVSISTATTTVCSGSVVTFSASGTNAGSSPIYTWKRNGTTVGTGTSITFLSGTLLNNDEITCELTANNVCQTSSTVTSNIITLTVIQSPAVGQISNGSVFITSAKSCTVRDTLSYYNSSLSGYWTSSNPTVATATPGSASSSSHKGKIVPLKNGTTTISYNVASSGCVSTATVTLTVDTVASLAPIDGNSSLCNLDSTQLSTANTGGVWSVPLGRATMTQSGWFKATSSGTTNARYTVTNSNGCSKYVEKTMTINVLPVANMRYITAPVRSGSFFCKNTSFTMSGSQSVPSGGTGSWSSNNISVATVNATSGLVSAVDVGTATISYTYTVNGCSNTRGLTGTVTTCPGYRGATNNNRIGNDNVFTIYPNPAKNMVSLQMNTLIGDGQIVVTDLFGKQVKQQTLSMGINQVDIANLSKGFYMISIITNEGKSTQKLIVE